MNQEETMLKHKERYKKTIKNLTVMSDIFARNVFKDKKACEYVLRIIMEDKDLTVIDNETQVDFRNMHGRGVVLDCVAKDGSERDAGGSIERPRARTERDRERSGAYVQGNGSPASGRRGGRKTGREKRECQKHGGRRHDGR